MNGRMALYPSIYVFISETGCPDGFYYNATRPYCHKVINLPMNYTDAIAHCKTLDAHLVKVNDAAENDHLANMLQAEGEHSTFIFTVNTRNVYIYALFEINISKLDSWCDIYKCCIIEELKLDSIGRETV